MASYPKIPKRLLANLIKFSKSNRKSAISIPEIREMMDKEKAVNAKTLASYTEAMRAINGTKDR